MRTTSLRALAAIAALALSAPASALADAVWPMGANQKIFPTSAPIPDGPPSLLLEAGQGEAEGGIIAARSDGGAIVPATVSDLVGPGTIPSSAIERYRVGYVTLSKTSTGVDALEGNRYADPLFPLAPGASLTLPAGETTGLYVLVNIPAGAAAGTYTGTVDFGALGKVPVELNVAPVPVNRDAYQVVGRLDVISLAQALGVPESDAGLRAGVYTKLLPMLRSRAVSPSQIPFGRPIIDPATWATNFADQGFNPIGTNIDTALALGFPRVEVPFLPLYGVVDDRQYQQDAKRRTFAKGLASKYGPVASRTFALPVDEPNEADYPVVKRAAAQLKSGGPIPVMVTEGPSDKAVAELNSSVDIWAPPLWTFYQYRSTMAKLGAQGKGKWWYVYGSDTQRYTPNFLIDKPTTEARVNGWLAAEEGVEGMFYWSLNAWRPGQVYQNPFQEPWRLSHVKQADKCGPGGREVGGNGEASLLYPGPSVAEPAIGTLRLESLRDGAEDYSLLQTLKARDPAYYQRVVDGVSRPYAGEHTGFDPCKPTNRPPYLPVIVTAPGDIEAARSAVIRKLSGGRLITLTGRFLIGGKPVANAWVRFGIFWVLTDKNGNWVLQDVPPFPGTIVLSRDPEGTIDRVEVQVTRAMVAQNAVPVAVPVLPARPSRKLTGLGKFVPRRSPARARTAGETLTMTIARRYTAAGRELPAELTKPPEVEAFYKRGRKDAKNRNWTGWKYLEFDIAVTRPGPPDQPWRLVVTPGQFRNARYLVVGQPTQHLRLPLAGLAIKDVRYLRFGLESALPVQKRGNHRIQVGLRVTNIRLTK